MAGRRSAAHPCGLLVAGALVFHLLWIRPRLVNWGATEDERTTVYPGDDLIPDATHSSTMATTLPAPPEAVWPWLVQMGGDRGGWYAWDWLDNAGRPSADRIVPEWQALDVGQHLYRAPRGPMNWFTVVVLEPTRSLVLRGSYGLLTGRSLADRSAPPPWAWVDGLWGFHLQPTPRGHTRLVIRQRSRSHPPVFARMYELLVGEPVHVAMQTRQLHNLSVRVRPVA